MLLLAMLCLAKTLTHGAVLVERGADFTFA
jgi:hypothetical protein